MKKNRLTLVMCIITFLIGIYFSYDSIGYPLKVKSYTYFLSFLPFIIYLLLYIFIIKNNNKDISKLKAISKSLACLLVIYYFFAAFEIGFNEATSSVTNTKYYNYYIAISNKKIKQVFPTKIPKKVKNVKFYYSPGILQGGTEYALYYIDKNMTLDLFNKKYKDKSTWNGYKNEYKNKNGVIDGAFSNTPSQYKNEDDFIIYLFDSKCDDSGYCNHGKFILSAFNEKTHEIIYKAESW